jgi:2-oxo-4-hydroxy-4-carboxy-5-ureidoimidazoline decarboxylase
VVALAQWNALPLPEARDAVLACCASLAWAQRLAAGRPYPDVAAVVAAGVSVLADLPWSEVRAAVEAHPRIGQRPAGGDREAAWSRREQAGAQDADPVLAAALVTANRAYEERFGHVFLIFATGRTAAHMLEAARRRLRNDEATERAVVRVELAKITGLRLERLLES